MTPRCSTCRYWRRQTPETGECRRRAPAPPADPAPGVAGRFGVFPLTMAAGWCGEHAEAGIPAEAARAR